MTLKAKLPTFEKGSADLGGQLRELLVVVAALCDVIEGPGGEAPAAPPEAPADEATEVEQEAPEAASDEPVEEEAPAVTKPASKPATRASAK